MQVALSFILNTLTAVTRDGVRICAKMLVKAFPLLAIPIFLVTAIASIVLNDALWAGAMEGVQFVESAGGSARTSFGSIYAKMNYFFPISESLLMLATLVPIKAMCIVTRILKSFVPLIN